MGKKPNTTHIRIFTETNKKVKQKKLPNETDAEFVDRVVDLYCTTDDSKCGKGK